MNDDVFARTFGLLLNQEMAKILTKLSLRVRPCRLRVTPISSRRWGEWDPVQREIRLSPDLVRHESWSLVMEVLRHEIAHMVAGDLLGGAEQTAHGQAFKLACGMLGISGHTPPVHEEERGRLLRKVQKLLALGESPNHHEAEAAILKAHEICLRANIALQEASSEKRHYTQRPLGAPFLKAPTWTWVILNLLEEHWFVMYLRSYVLVPGEPMLGHPTASQQSVILIHGTPENLDLAEYVYHFLINQGEIEWRQYRAASLRKGERRDHFLYGLYTGFAARIGAERRELERQHALVLKRDAVLEDFFDLLHPSVRRSKGRGLGLDQSTFAAGQAAGRQMQIRPGLDPRGSGGIKGYLG